MITYNILRLNEWFDLRIKDMTGLGNYDDLNHTDNLVESDMRELFTFIITAKKDDDNEDCYEVHVWDYTGRLLVCQYQFNIDNDYLPTHIQAQIRADMNDFSYGLIKCAHCEKKINMHVHYRQRLFAGIYCDEDWQLPYVQNQVKYESKD